MISRLVSLLLTVALPASAQVVERWVNRYNGTGNYKDMPQAVAVDGSGNVVVTGYSYNASGNNDYYTAKYAAADGALLWEKPYNGSANSSETAVAMALDAADNVIVTGSCNAGVGADICTVKYAAADGALLWDKRYNGPGNDDDSPFDLEVDGNGNAIITGVTTNIFGSEMYYTAKYAGVNGALLWERSYAGLGNHGGSYALALDGSGNVVVTGSSRGSAGNSDIYTAKYAASDGALLWEIRYNGPENKEDSASKVRVDGNDNVIISGYGGYSYSGSPVAYGYMAKYKATNGSLLWEKRFDDPGVAAMAVDLSGDVFLAGGIRNDANYVDYYTAKYSGAVGNLLWENRYNGPENGYDVATALALDNRGNVVVTGNSRGSGGYGMDAYTAKYANADGALLWDRRSTGQISSPDYPDWPRRVAATPDGGAVVVSAAGSAVFPDYITVYYAPATPHEAWRHQYFETTDNTGIAADNADPDHDGLPNLIEWACALNPTTFSPPPATAAHDRRDFTFLYPRSVAAVSAGTLFTVEWTNTLAAGDWRIKDVSETILSDNGTVQQVRATLPAGPGKRFARLRVSSPP